MRMGNGLAAALVVAAAGTFVPGCLSSGSTYQPFGRICAVAAGGEEVCVPAEEGPASAWSEAMATGSLPVAMWVEPSGGMTLEDVVRSGDNLGRWFATIDKVIAYVRDTKGNAESYKVTMEGKLGAWLREARDRQKELLSKTPADAAGNFKSAVIEKASAEKDPLLAAVASDKQAMGVVHEVFEEAKADIGPLVDDSEQAIVATALDASAKPGQLTLAAMKLSAQIQQFELASQEAIKPQADFMATHGAALPDMTSAALRSLNAMLGYMQRRVARSDATATGLLLGVSMRRKALEMLAGVSPAVRAQVATAKLQKAGAVFSDASKARVHAVQGALPVSAKLGLPYLAKRYDELTRLLQMQPLCDPASSSWREMGCASLRDNFDGASTYLKTTLPAQLVTGLATMKAAGVEAALLDAAKAKLDAGDVKAAAVLHDAALRSAEGT
ncbi:MAG TPA: hypothetical protein VE093_06215 [Polyangiaceae bacterium]|nr:hypothetical protein [Polyangiaceae bacterium]